ncbi:DUF4469 domain-containing protein [uncultured Treponema sp.]|uniref:DUF4469 domain-containing protein n=1 Tax=uncultured Treponema sp. TaxID=162155 RepID=UPI0025FBE461|nr:DUF4469 domain-containing protein [uncultured Treponema sp.]
MAAIENISTLENSSSVLSISLHENRFTKDGTYYATVSRNKASFKNILSEIAEDNKGMDPFMLQFAAILIQKKILKMLEQGKAVNLLDIGTLYIAMKCNVKGKSDVSESGNFYIKFTPTSLVNEAISKLSVDKIVYAGSSPEILQISDLKGSAQDGTLIKGNPAKIKGSQLKLGGGNSGLYFAPVDSDEKVVSNESLWIRVDDKSVFRNMPSELNFFVPAELENGRYRIVLRSSYLSKNVNRKNTVEAVSNLISITEQ